MSFTLTINARVPICRDLSFDVVEALTTFSGQIELGDLSIVVDAVATPLLDVLLAEELSAFDEPPRPARQVSKLFDPPVILRFESSDLATISAVSATVGESDLDPVIATVDPGVLSMLKNALTGGRLWFGEDGRVVETLT